MNFDCAASTSSSSNNFSELTSDNSSESDNKSDSKRLVVSNLTKKAIFDRIVLLKTQLKEKNKEQERDIRKRRLRHRRKLSKLKEPHAMLRRSEVRNFLHKTGTITASKQHQISTFTGAKYCNKCSAVILSGKRCDSCRITRYEKDPVRFIAKRLIKDAHKRSEQSNKKLDIDTEWFAKGFALQEGRCALCGLEMTTLDSRVHKHETQQQKVSFMRFPLNVSIDQKDPGCGYTQTNAQLVHLRCNIAKLDMRQDDFLSMCKAVAAFHLSPG